VGRQFAGMVNEVPPCRDSNTVWVRFLWMEIDDNASISDSLICGDTFDFIVSHDKIELVPFCPILLLPCAMPSKSLPNAVCHTSDLAGSCISCLELLMLLPVLGWIIGIATCAKLRQEGADFVLSFVGVHISGEFSQTYLVRKFMASCDIKFLLCNPPLTGTKRMCGI
jgi:hypothetical protein